MEREGTKMAKGNSSNDLQKIMEEIRSSEIVEDRIWLFTELGNVDLTEIPDLASLVDFLITFWEDFTCLDTSQCMLNRSILLVASKYVQFDLSRCLPQILTLGIKASVWCGKHLKMTLLSTQDSQEDEHSSLFYQLLQDVLSFSASTLSGLMMLQVFGEKALMDTVEKFILEVLILTKDSVSDVKKNESFGAEILKITHIVIDAVIKLCKVSDESVNWETFDEKPLSLRKPDSGDYVINITNCAIEKLSQIGVIAANNGGNSVNILNVSWKGVVSLLQIGRGNLAEKVKIANVVVTLLTLVTEHLKCAAEAWCSSQKETISVPEAKRIFVPVKFFLINAVKICSFYPCQAYAIYREIILCVLMVSTFRIELNKKIPLKSACMVITELLEQTSLDLVISLLNSDKVKLEQKLEVLECLLTNEVNSHSSVDNPTVGVCSLTTMSDIFSISCEGMGGARILIIGRVALFISLLRVSLELDEDVKVGIAKKLQWCLDTLVEEDLYSNMLILQIPLISGSGKTAQLVWQPLFTSLLNAIKTFMIVISSSKAWPELESFLLEDMFHPHFLCWEIVMECWCFVLRYGETEFATNIIGKLCSLLKLLASSDSVLLPNSSLRILARSICVLLTHGTQAMINQVYVSLIGDDSSQLSSILCLALFIEGFPLKLLSDELRHTALKRIISDYFEFIESFHEAPLVAHASGLFGIPVFILSAYLQSLPTSLSDIDARTLKFMVSIGLNYRNSADEKVKEHYLRLLGEILGIIASVKHLYTSHGIEEAILELQNIFISAGLDAQLYKCKPGLAQFMAGLIHMEISEEDDDAKSCAVWELYHMLLKERHWAFIHLALTAFGYFAARTKCNQLWRFVPDDAALSYDAVSGEKANKDRFMRDFKAFLEKEMALLTIEPCPEKLKLLGREGRQLKETVHKISDIAGDEWDVRPWILIITNNQIRKGNFLMDSREEWICLRAA
ncbi:hypothetical protein L6164_016526 [Bauhinia variegata]|uniref:Uncharacterized protein n=1 Tax=Bauhinia variegata TaxID=167791 RepID=A0ACB9NPN2_BAUVA|nr:hypothetical protein L6164_016526 [Bauhinia variegata]